MIRKYNLSVEIKIQKENFTLSLLRFKLKLDYNLICIENRDGVPQYNIFLGKGSFNSPRQKSEL